MLSINIEVCNQLSPHCNTTMKHIIYILETFVNLYLFDKGLWWALRQILRRLTRLHESNPLTCYMRIGNYLASFMAIWFNINITLHTKLLNTEMMATDNGHKWPLATVNGCKHSQQNVSTKGVIYEYRAMTYNPWCLQRGQTKTDLLSVKYYVG